MFVQPPLEAREKHTVPPDFATFSSLPIQAGLTSYSVTDILKDQYGFIWIATVNGINRFDGHRVKKFLATAAPGEGPASNRISQLEEDDQDHIWMFDSYNQVLVVYSSRSSRFTPVALPENDLILHLTQDHVHQTWLSSASNAYLWNPSDSLFQPHALSKLNKKLEKYMSPQKRMRPIVTRLMSTRELTDTYFNAPKVDSVFSVAQSILRNLDRFLKDSAPAKVSITLVRDVVVSRDSALWVATENNGLFRLKKAKGEHWTDARLIVEQASYHTYEQNKLPSNDIMSLYEDNEGILWVGTRDKGIFSHHRNRELFGKVNRVRLKDGWVEIGTVRAIAEDKRGHTWVGSQENGVFEFDTAFNFKRIIREDLPSNIIRALHFDKTGKLWIGHYEGLSLYDPSTGQVKNDLLARYKDMAAEYGHPGHCRVYEIIEDPQGNLYISFWFFVVKYNPYTHHSEIIDLSAGISPSQQARDPIKTRCMIYSNDDRVIIGSENYGVFIFDPATGKVEKPAPAGIHPALSDNIFKITPGHEPEEYFLSSSGGMYRLNIATLQIFSDHKLAQNHARTYATLQDHEGALWISTVNGLWYYHVAKDSLQRFDFYDGLPSNEFTKNGLLPKGNGLLVFGTNRGLVYVDPANFKQQKSGKTRMILYYKEHHLDERAKITLSSEEKSLGLNVHFPSYVTPETNRISYRIKGWEEAWQIQDARENLIFYENVPYGSYLLEVKAYNEKNLGFGDYRSIAIVNPPPFWKSWWFIVLLALLAALLSFWIHHQRITFLRKEKEIKLANYQSELSLLKSQITPHFLFNTLNNIYSLCVLDPARAGDIVINLSKMLRYMLYECSTDRVLLAKEVNFLRQYAALQKEKGFRDESVTFNITGEIGDQEIVPFLLINFVENSFKHSDLSRNKNGYIYILVTIDNNILTFNARNSYGRSSTLEGGDLHKGLGIEHTRRRLNLFYPGQHEFNIKRGIQTFEINLKINLSI